MQKRMGNCQVRTAPWHTPHGRNNLNPFLSMPKLVLTTDRVEWMKGICVMNGLGADISSPSRYSCSVTTGI